MMLWGTKELTPNLSDTISRTTHVRNRVLMLWAVLGAKMMLKGQK